jgi:Cu-processing system permease protein
MRRVLTIAHLTWLEARRRRIVAAAVLCALLFLVVYGVAVFFIERHLPLAQRQTMLQFFTLAGLYAANFLTIATAILLAVDTLSGEITSGVMQTLASKPVHRAEIVLGKWLTYLAMSGGYLLVTAGGVLLVVLVLTGFVQPNIERALPLLLLGVAVMLTISIAGGVRFTTTTNGIIAFAFYGVAFIGGWVEQIGVIMNNESARYIGTLVSLVSPVDALWRRTAYELQPPIMRELQITPFSSASVPSTMMLIWAAGFIVAVLAFAVWQFRRRPL